MHRYSINPDSDIPIYRQLVDQINAEIRSGVLPTGTQLPTVREMAELVAKLDAAWKQMGCVINSPYMTMALVPLACLPELRLTNRGLVDCRTFRFVPLFAEE